MNINEICYLAGLVDGEGTIGIGKVPSMPSRRVFISVSTTTPELINWLQVSVGGNITQNRPKSETDALAYRWQLTGQKALDLIKTIFPYLRCHNKLARAKLIIEQYKPVYRGTPVETRKQVADFELAFMKLSNERKGFMYSDIVLEVYPELKVKN